jgi:hypothetical protein
MDWYKVQLTWEQQADNEMASISDQLNKIWHDLGSPKGVVLYKSTGTTEPITFYFSPDASKVAESIIENYEGIPCEKPQSSMVVLVLGHDSE